MKLKAVAIALLLMLSVLGFFFVNVVKVSASLPFESGKIKINVYAIALNGVAVMGIGNVSRMLEGIAGAVDSVNRWNYSFVWFNEASDISNDLNVSHYIYHVPLEREYLTAEFPVNATMKLVRDWDVYKNIVENEVECVIINTHGEVIPVPAGYSKEAWTDKIAEAMRSRNVTWVHAGGYPFSYVWYEGESTSAEPWADSGFQHLMRHIDEGNITLPPYGGEYKPALGQAEIYLKDTWPGIYGAFAASVDYPLQVQDFAGYVPLSIWEVYESLYVGAVVAFKTEVNVTKHGFYVHIGTDGTFRMVGNDLESTEVDGHRGFIGCAAGLWSLVSRTARETLIFETEGLIQKAALEGRTEGLQLARDFLESAKNSNNLYYYQSFHKDIYRAMLAADSAKKPEINLLQILLAGFGVGVTSAVGIGGVIWYRKKSNGRKNE